MKTSLKPLEYPNAAAVRDRLRIVLDGLGDECMCALANEATDDDVLEELDYLSMNMEEIVELIIELKQHVKESHSISSEREDSNLQ